MTYFFTNESLYFLIPFIHFIYPSTILLTGNHQSVLYEFCFVVAFIFPCEIIWYLSFFVWLISLSITLSVHTTQLKIYAYTFTVYIFVCVRAQSPQFSSFTQSCPTLHDPMDCSMPGFPVCHQLPEFTQTHVHRVGDTIQPSYPLSSPSPPAFNLSQHHSLFQWVVSSHQVAKVLEFQLRHQSFQWIFRTDLL